MLNLLVFLLLLVLKEKSTLLSLKTASQPKAAVYLRPLNGSVAQLDRASDYGSEGLGFESLRDRTRVFYAHPEGGLRLNNVIPFFFDSLPPLPRCSLFCHDPLLRIRHAESHRLPTPLHPPQTRTHEPLCYQNKKIPSCRNRLVRSRFCPSPNQPDPKRFF